MEPEDQPVGLVLVVVVGKPQREAPRSAAALNRDVAAVAGADVLPRLARDRRERQRRGLAAPGASHRARAARRRCRRRSRPPRRRVRRRPSRLRPLDRRFRIGRRDARLGPPRPDCPPPPIARRVPPRCRLGRRRPSKLPPVPAAARAGGLTGAAVPGRAGRAAAAGLASARAATAAAGRACFPRRHRCRLIPPAPPPPTPDAPPRRQRRPTGTGAIRAWATGERHQGEAQRKDARAPESEPRAQVGRTSSGHVCSLLRGLEFDRLLAVAGGDDVGLDRVFGRVRRDSR